MYSKTAEMSAPTLPLNGTDCKQQKFQKFHQLFYKLMVQMQCIVYKREHLLATLHVLSTNTFNSVKLLHNI
jgi:hypothetical protein